MNLIPVILAGGVGTRLSPLSSSTNPKQFLPILKNGNSLFTNTYRRCTHIAPISNITIVTNQNLASQTWHEIYKTTKLSNPNVILEPCSRNTAAAIGIAALHALHLFDDPILWVTPSDHYIENDAYLRKTIFETAQNLSANEIATFGIKPHNHNSNYGHIIPGAKLSNFKHYYKVKSFLEKPKKSKLRWAMQQPQCMWNSGMFVMHAKTLLRHKAMNQINNFINMAFHSARGTSLGIIPGKAAYSLLPSISIDKLIMESSNKLTVRPLNTSWTDVGSWNSLMDLYHKNLLNNFLVEKYIPATYAIKL